VAKYQSLNDFSRDPECTMAPDSRFDCARDKAVSQSECEQRGCCYAPGSDSAGPPWCFYPGLYRGYRMGPLMPTLHGLTATLTRAAPSYLPRDISVLIPKGNRLFLLQMKDPSSPRYEVELPAVVVREETDAEDLLYTTEYQPDPFGFIVRRKTNGRVIMNTTVAPLLFADQYLQLSTTLASHLVSGLGQHYSSLLLDVNWTTLALWNRDMAPHVILQPTPALTWIALGGILDLYVFLGPDPQSVVRQYLQVIGYSMMPPYWSLGFHLCRWGYTTTNATREVVQRMRDAEFPMDVQWNDLDYAYKRRVFTLDPLRFGDLPEMVEEFHMRGLRYILILVGQRKTSLRGNNAKDYSHAGIGARFSSLIPGFHCLILLSIIRGRIKCCPSGKRIIPS
uniref:Lysosomal alpha-glucosidase n=1 Tax=Takifugu rubripes TaxID=31033 RepID=A0A674MZW2_TAKRU